MFGTGDLPGRGRAAYARRPEHSGVQDGRYQPRIGVSIWLKDRLEEHLQP